MASRATAPTAEARESAQLPLAPELRFTERDWRDFDTPVLTARWDALAHWAVEPNPFYESWYLLPSLRALDPAGKVVLLCLEADGELAGLIPVRRQLWYYGHPLPHLSGWAHANCFLGAPLVARGCEGVFWRALFAWADRQAGLGLFLHLPHIPRAGTLYEALCKALAFEGRPAAIVHEEQRALLASNLSSESYLEETLTAKKRKELRRQQRRLAEEGRLEVERTDGSEGLEQWIGQFLALESSGWKGTSGSALASSPATARIFAQALQGAAARGKLERLSLLFDGRPIAMLATFLTPPGAFSYKTAFDEDFARFSPGVLLQLENLGLLERPDVAWCDSCAGADHPMIDHLWRERRTVVRVNIAIGGPVRRALFRAIAAKETGRSPGELA